MALICMLTAGFVSPAAFGQFDRNAPTFFLETEAGLTTYKSKLVESNDTSFGVRYTFGINAGRSKNVGMLVRTETNSTTFELNESAISTTIQDLILRYHWGPAYIGVILNSGAL